MSSQFWSIYFVLKQTLEEVSCHVKGANTGVNVSENEWFRDNNSLMQWVIAILSAWAYRCLDAVVRYPFYLTAFLNNQNTLEHCCDSQGPIVYQAYNLVIQNWQETCGWMTCIPLILFLSPHPFLFPFPLSPKKKVYTRTFKSLFEEIISSCCSSIHSGPVPLWWWQLFQQEKKHLEDKD